MTTVATSYWPADTSEPILQTTVGGVLREAAAAGPDMLAMVGGVPDPAQRGRWTYAELLAEAEQAARALTTRFAPGERVAVWAPNLPEWVILEFAAALAGLVLVTVNPGVLPGAPGAVQDAAALGLRGSLPHDALRQDPEVQAARGFRPAHGGMTPVRRW